MYISDYFIEEQMTKYELRLDVDKAWDPTLDHISKLFVQPKAYGGNRAANSRLESATPMYNVPSDRTITMTTSSSDLTSHDLYIESLDESLALSTR
jgi:hypothetical protein